MIQIRRSDDEMKNEWIRRDSVIVSRFGFPPSVSRIINQPVSSRSRLKANEINVRAEREGTGINWRRKLELRGRPGPSAAPAERKEWKLANTFEPFRIRSASVTCPSRTLFRFTPSTRTPLFHPFLAHSAASTAPDANRSEDRRVFIFNGHRSYSIYCHGAAAENTSADPPASTVTVARPLTGRSRAVLFRTDASARKLLRRTLIEISKRQSERGYEQRDSLSFSQIARAFSR